MTTPAISISSPVLSLTLEGWDITPDTANKTRGQHWKKRQERAALAKEYVFVALRGSGIGRVTIKLPATIHYTRVRGKGQRALDDENLHSGTKPLTDALVHFGVLPDDTKEFLSKVTASETKSEDGRPAVRIEIRAACA